MRRGDPYGRGYGDGYGYGYGPYGPPRVARRGIGWQEACCFTEGACCAFDALECMNLMTIWLLVRSMLSPRFLRSVTAGHPDRHVHARGRLAQAMCAGVSYYRTRISPTRPPCCNLTPSCSTYAVTAISRHGALRGGWLTLRRLARCRPSVRGGYDPVPGVAGQPV